MEKTFTKVDRLKFLRYNQNMRKKALNTNFEVYNYLNITNRKLSKLYKYSGFNVLPKDFDINQQTFAERLYLNQMKKDNIFPPFSIVEKKEIKKFIKNSLKNMQKVAKNGYFADKFSSDFAMKVELYFDMRFELTRILLKDFNDQDMDEVAMYQEIYNLNPVFAEFFEDLYSANVNLPKLFEGLEEKYNNSYLAKLKTLEKKVTKKQEKTNELHENLQHQKNAIKSKNAEKDAKNVEKTVKNTKKATKTNEIKQVKAENKKAKQKVREKL